jgi:hypothetical protein
MESTIAELESQADDPMGIGKWCDSWQSDH